MEYFKKNYQGKFSLIWVNPFQSSVAFHIETSHLICNTNQTTEFFMQCNTGLKCVNTSTTSLDTYSNNSSRLIVTENRSYNLRSFSNSSDNFCKVSWTSFSLKLKSFIKSFPEEIVFCIIFTRLPYSIARRFLLPHVPFCAVLTTFLKPWIFSWKKIEIKFMFRCISPLEYVYVYHPPIAANELFCLWSIFTNEYYNYMRWFLYHTLIMDRFLDFLTASL